MTDALLKRVQPGAAKNAFTEIRTFLRWCVKRRYIEHSPIEGMDSPARLISRERVLSDDELRLVWQAAGNSAFGSIVKLLILTGQRRSEIAGLRSDWLSDDGCTIPGNYTKNKRVHSFPMGALSGAVLSPIYPSQAGLLFSARGQSSSPFNGWSKAKAQLDKQANIEPWTLHDLRRTYATNLQRHGVRLEVIEALLNHVSGTRAGIVGVYNRHRYEPEMREAVGKYDEWFERTIIAANNEEA